MNHQLADHGHLHHDSDFYEAPEEFIMGKENEVGDHDISEAPEDEHPSLTEQAVNGSSSEILFSQEEKKHTDQESLEEEKKVSTFSQISQDQQQQQQSPPAKICSDPDLKEEDIQHPLTEGKTLQEFDGSGNSHSINSNKSTIEQQGSMEPIQYSQEKEQQGHTKNLVEEMEASIPTQNLQDQAQEQQEVLENSAEKVIPRASGSSLNLHPKRVFCTSGILVSIVVSTFALIIGGKLLRRS